MYLREKKNQGNFIEWNHTPQALNLYLSSDKQIWHISEICIFCGFVEKTYSWIAGWTPCNLCFKALIAIIKVTTTKSRQMEFLWIGFQRGWESFTSSVIPEVLRSTFQVCQLLQLKPLDSSFLFWKPEKSNIAIKGKSYRDCVSQK